MTNAAVGADHQPVALDLPELRSTIVAHGDRKGNTTIRNRKRERQRDDA
jgi:hypothetical protein